jgi:hypothetical protein
MYHEKENKLIRAGLEKLMCTCGIIPNLSLRMNCDKKGS